jgi:mono/diheme cytochrome c family protein
MGGATSADLRWAKLGDMYHADVSLVTGAILNGKDQDGKDLDATMPRWQDKLTSQQVSDVIAYLQTFTTDAAANVPLAAPAGASPGEVLFYQDCTVCHGVDGAGDKKIGTSTSGDLRWAKLINTYQNDVSLVSRAILQNLDKDGKTLDPEMPRWQDTLTPEQVQQIIVFLQTLK